MPRLIKTRLAAAGIIAATAMALLAAVTTHAAATVQPGPIIGATLAAGPAVTNTVVDTSGTPAAQYRLPAAAVTADGTTVACYDSRNLSSADLPADIDIVCRSSADEGVTWSARRLAVAHIGGNTDATAYGVGDPQLTFDSNTGVLFLAYLAAPPGIGLSASSTDASVSSTSTVHVVYRTSSDDGVTWSGPTDLTALAKAPGNVGGIFASSGHGVQLSNRVLVVPYAYYQGGTSFTGILYTGNDGGSWAQMSTGAAGNENKIVEQSNGSLLDDIRSNNGGPLYRQLAVYNAGTGVWGAATAPKFLPDPMVNGDILRVDPVAGQPDSGWLIESGADSQTTRDNGLVRESRDDGQTWLYAWTVTSFSSYTAFGYSTLVQFGDGTFGVLFEHTSADTSLGAGASLVFTRFTQGVFAP